MVALSLFSESAISKISEHEKEISFRLAEVEELESSLRYLIQERNEWEACIFVTKKYYAPKTDEEKENFQYAKDELSYYKAEVKEVKHDLKIVKDALKIARQDLKRAKQYLKQSKKELQDLKYSMAA